MDFEKQFRSRRNILNLPNTLSFLRILLIPVMAVFLAYDTEQPLFRFDVTFRYSPGRMATLVVILAGITDLLDGYFARKWKIESVMGRFLDPVADKLFLMVALVMLMQLGRVNVWLVIALLSRELFITGLRTVAAGEGILISAERFGKIKTIFQLVGIGFLCWYGSIFTLRAYTVGTVILYLALAISLFSGYRYVSGFLKALAQKRDQEDAEQELASGL
ncbi:MAG: CDP-diacylglycerol--glycerol-3-phosphate 3-phosphatidyltransferase [Bdellovibrionaceae bacterium]|nr:CDP-diacylglycerol--glycerol-3-phosphate 3-phosphatidyltransferase [Bdellovibrionales bacterium]MCB9255493.1 CDP-diacylglycerol--glycerol-3-phosphate 3-phosphatidyltransferase [Pseudobdellovibrionaceae bacterium]